MLLLLPVTDECLMPLNSEQATRYIIGNNNMMNWRLFTTLLLGVWVANSFLIGLPNQQGRRRSLHTPPLLFDSPLYSTVTPEADAISSSFNNNDDDENNDESQNHNANKQNDTINIVLTTGFESFNRDLYQKAGQLLPSPLLSNINLQVFADSDIRTQTEEFTTAVQNADLFIGSLIFDYDDVVAVSELLPHVKGPRLLFECATELMAYNKVGSFNMDNNKEGGSNNGPPPAVKAILNKFSSGKEEDKINGYLKMLKVGPDLLKFIPG